jgi:hypothetical protein
MDCSIGSFQKWLTLTGSRIRQNPQFKLMMQQTGQLICVAGHTAQQTDIEIMECAAANRTDVNITAR